MQRQEIVKEIVDTIMQTKHAKFLAETMSLKEIESFVSDLKKLSPEILTNPVIVSLPDNSTRLYAEITVTNYSQEEHAWVPNALMEAIVESQLDLNIYITVI